IGSDELVQTEPAPVMISGPGVIDDRHVALLGNQVAGAAGRVALSAGFPNPARGPVEFALELAQESRVEWAVYDVQGRIIWSESRTLAAGRSQLRWDGTAVTGEPAAVGIYLVRARVDGA